MPVVNTHRRAPLSLIVALLCAVGVSHAAEMPVLHPEKKRITDPKIHADLTMLKATQDRIAKLNNNGIGADNYFLVKAQSWLDFAMHEYYENDRTSVIDEALFEAQDLIDRMEAADSNITMDTTLITQSQRLREDLWIIAAQMKNHQGLSCAAAPLAEMEVRLVWAGHENKELGWRHAREHFAAAERLAKQAKKLAENCFCPPAAEKPCPLLATPEPVVVPPVVDAPKPVVEPKLMALVNVPNNVHFGLNKSDINTKAVVILDRVVEILRAYPNIKITLIGHTDSRASKAYNQALSERRAKSVLSHLNKLGIAASRMDIKAEGFNALKTNDDALLGHALSRRVEIAYQGENIESYDQTGDLVLEEVKQPKVNKLKAKATKARMTKKKLKG